MTNGRDAPKNTHKYQERQCWVSWLDLREATRLAIDAIAGEVNFSDRTALNQVLEKLGMWCVCKWCLLKSIFNERMATWTQTSRYFFLTRIPRTFLFARLMRMISGTRSLTQCIRIVRTGPSCVTSNYASELRSSLWVRCHKTFFQCNARYFEKELHLYVQFRMIYNQYTCTCIVYLSNCAVKK